MSRTVSVLCLLLGTFVMTCSNSVDPLIEIAEIKVILDRYHLAQQKEDMTALSALFAQDDELIVFGFRQGERHVGWEAVRDWYQRQMDSVEGLQTTLKDQVTRISKGGKAAWVSSLCHSRGTIGSQAVEMDYRITVVLEKRGGKWLIVHLHSSLPAGQEASGL